MSMNLEKQTFSTAPEYFIAGANIDIATAVKTAAADLEAHAPVALDADGKLAAVTAENMGSIYGVLPEAVASGEDAVVYLTGEYFADSLALPDGVTAADVEVPLRNIGIFLK